MQAQMATPGNIRCARCSMVVLDAFNAIAQDLMQFQPISGPDVYHMIMNDPHFRKRRLNSDEMHTIQTLLNDGFSRLDFSLIYKIATYFRGLIPPPTRNWGANPLPKEIESGDDVERIRKIRNRYVHKINADISEEEMNALFDTSIEIGKRIDKHLNIKGQISHEETITKYRSCSMEPETTEKYLLALQRIESLKKKLTVQMNGRELHFYEGKSIAQVADTIVKESLNGEQTTAVKVIFHDVKDEDEQIKLLNKLSSENNINTENIKFILATKECIAVLVFLRNTVLVDSTLLLSEVNQFVQKIISSTRMKFFSEKVLSIVVVSSEDETVEWRSQQSDESEIDSQKPNPKEDIHALILNLEIKNKVFHSEKSVQDNFEKFFGNIVERTNGRIFSQTDEAALNVVLAVNDHDAAQSLNTSHTVKDAAQSLNTSHPVSDTKQHIILNQQNKRTIQKLEIQLKTLTEQNRKLQEKKQKPDLITENFIIPMEIKIEKFKRQKQRAKELSRKELDTIESELKEIEKELNKLKLLITKAARKYQSTVCTIY